MREIKFRAFSINKNRWVYGYLVKTPITAEFNDVYGAFFDSASSERTEWAGRYCIVTVDGVAHEVDTKTLGQYTGLKDKNGKEIYEGDVVSGVGHGVIEFTEGKWRINRSAYGLVNLYPTHTVEVIGNIYENPELLK